jgi:hypothetical protein
VPALYTEGPSRINQKERKVMLSLVEFSDVNGSPAIKLDLPRLFVGDPVRLKFRLQRINRGRTEVLEADTTFRITAVGFDTNTVPHRQLLSVETTQPKPPTWVAVKRPPEVTRKLPPARFPKTPI